MGCAGGDDKETTKAAGVDNDPCTVTFADEKTPMNFQCNGEECAHRGKDIGTQFHQHTTLPDFVLCPACFGKDSAQDNYETIDSFETLAATNFNRIDSDGDGKIVLQEVIDHWSTSGNSPTDEHAKQFFGDKDFVDLGEYKEMLRATMKVAQV
eukprot:TRINITY_DN1728_c0_g2_i1.p1 TRINITY_DN1728_c0_g2~~TRINITY_DN1728_c0_g2_i1.p1  ORF type:complete len:153 (-),score=42.14 TRINITY_DN1728_c0_g2_i1:314-772(-)